MTTHPRHPRRRLPCGLFAALALASAVLAAACGEGSGGASPDGELPVDGDGAGAGGSGGSDGTFDGGSVTLPDGNVVPATPDGGPARPTKTDPKPLGTGDGLYPRVIKTEDGTLVASVVRFRNGKMDGVFFTSTDGGLSFVEVGALDDALTRTGLCCGTLFEMPRTVGQLPKGALLFSASVGGDTPDAPMSAPLWMSTDKAKTWRRMATIVRGRVNRAGGGLWEPEFSVLDDGSLVCHLSDETDRPAHSQKLVALRSTDGVTWGQPRDTVAPAAAGLRPGMPVVRRLPGGPFVMTYEICALPGDSCTAFLRTSNDGWNWGNVAAYGTRLTTLEGKHLRHAPTLAIVGQPRRLFVVGQMVYTAAGGVSPGDNGTVVFANTEGGSGAWFPVPAPVTVPSPFDHFCPNYSSSLIEVEPGVGLQIATRLEGNVCKPYFARGPLLGTGDATGFGAEGVHRFTSLVGNKCLDVAGNVAGANVQQLDCNGTDFQAFTVTRRADGAFALKSRASGLCVVSAGGGAAAGTNVEARPCTGGDAEAWIVKNVGFGYYALVRKGTSTCLDVAGGSPASGANVQQWTCNDLSPQIWRVSGN